ncbi:MAG: NAD(P)-dependent malic enzyme [Candidatus Bilamarchaeaceae archaeon]
MDPNELHRQLKGKITVRGKTPINNAKDLSLLYTPGVADPCRSIAKDKSLAYEMTMKSNAVAIVTDGTRVLGLGNIGPEAALPVMEGKAMIMAQFAGLDAFPICLDCRDEDKIIETVKNIAPVFGLINLEDIETPKVFRIHERLTEELDIPVFHDDQHGTAMVVLAGLINALKVLRLGKDVRIAMVGSGSAGYAITHLLHHYGFKDITVFDSQGAISRSKDLPEHKRKLAEMTNPSNFNGKLEGFMGAQVLISASKPGAVPLETLKNMKKPNIVFSLSNPAPEVPLELARELGIDIFGTGRSDYPNQINNAVCFPGFIRALLDLKVRRITYDMYVKGAVGIANTVKDPDRGNIIPSPFDKDVVANIKAEMGR